MARSFKPYLIALGITLVPIAVFALETHPKREVDCVFGLWYGKGPGVDRSATP